MNPAQLLAHFDLMADAPDAIPRLRRFVLDLAVRGKLVEQDSTDEPAAALLHRIDAEQSRLAKEKDLPREAEVARVTFEDEPFARPSNWQWVRLGRCMRMVNGRAFKPSEWQMTGLPIVRIQNLNSTSAPFNHCDPRTVDARHIIDNGEFLISWSGTPGTSFGAFIWNRGKAALNQHIFKCFQIGAAFDDRFLRLAVNGRLDEMISKAHGGVGLQHITKGKLENLVLSLPPLAEQGRIVAKMDELMALCDKLEAAQTQRESRRDRLVLSSLNRLNRPDDDAARFRDHARFTLDNLPRLTTRPEHVPQVRQMILHLAVRGKLVSQDPDDIMATELAGRSNTKVSLIADETAVPFGLPRPWNWARLGQLSELINGDRSKNYPNKAEYVQDGVAWINTGHIEPDGTLSIDGMHYISRKKFDSLRGGKVRLNDLVYCLRGATLGKTAIISQFNEGAVASSLVILRLSPLIDSKFAYRVLTSPLGRQEIQKFDNGTAQPNLSANSVKKYWVPLPPLAEQHRIVAKVDELMALCDRLESQLTTTQTESRRLLEAVLHEALNN